MTGQDTDRQERAGPKSRADLDHRALPAIQSANHTHDLQTGDVGAVLRRNKGCGEETENRHKTPVNNSWTF